MSSQQHASRHRALKSSYFTSQYQTIRAELRADFFTHTPRALPWSLSVSVCGCDRIDLTSLLVTHMQIISRFYLF